jgi:hypothetical protein
MPLSDHQLAETTSLAWHAEIARRIRKDPQILDRARARVASWTEVSPLVP